MNREQLTETVVGPMLQRVSDLFKNKGDEYAIGGTFHNFEEAAKRLNKKFDTDFYNPIKALAGMVVKQQVSIDDLLQKYNQHYCLKTLEGEEHTVFKPLCSKDSIIEKYGDDIVYKLLELAMLLEFYDIAVDKPVVVKQEPVVYDKIMYRGDDYDIDKAKLLALTDSVKVPDNTTTVKTEVLKPNLEEVKVPIEDTPADLTNEILDNDNESFFDKVKKLTK